MNSKNTGIFELMFLLVLFTLSNNFNWGSPLFKILRVYILREMGLKSNITDNYKILDSLGLQFDLYFQLLIRMMNLIIMSRAILAVALRKTWK